MRQTRGKNKERLVTYGVTKIVTTMASDGSNNTVTLRAGITAATTSMIRVVGLLKDQVSDEKKNARARMRSELSCTRGSAADCRTSSTIISAKTLLTLQMPVRSALLTNGQIIGISNGR